MLVNKKFIFERHTLKVVIIFLNREFEQPLRMGLFSDKARTLFLLTFSLCHFLFFFFLTICRYTGCVRVHCLNIWMIVRSLSSPAPHSYTLAFVIRLIFHSYCPLLNFAVYCFFAQLLQFSYVHQPFIEWSLWSANLRFDHFWYVKFCMIYFYAHFQHLTCNFFTNLSQNGHFKYHRTYTQYFAIQSAFCRVIALRFILLSIASLHKSYFSCIFTNHSQNDHIKRCMSNTQTFSIQ